MVSNEEPRNLLRGSSLFSFIGDIVWEIDASLYDFFNDHFPGFQVFCLGKSVFEFP
jgi:hypothetical protein